MREYSINNLKQILQSPDSIFNKKAYISQYLDVNSNNINALKEGISEIVSSPSLNDDEKIQCCFDAGPELISHSFKELKAQGLKEKTDDLELKFLKYGLEKKSSCL